jgi:hypothetical protein
LRLFHAAFIYNIQEQFSKNKMVKSVAQLKQNSKKASIAHPASSIRKTLVQVPKRPEASRQDTHRNLILNVKKLNGKTTKNPAQLTGHTAGSARMKKLQQSVSMKQSPVIGS